MTHFDWYESGALFGIRYRFEHRGDALPTHAHDRSTLHNIIVLKGSVRVREFDISLSAGVVFDFNGTLTHTVEALEPDTQVLHLFLHGKPADYAALPDSEKHGTLG